MWPQPLRCAHSSRSSLAQLMRSATGTSGTDSITAGAATARLCAQRGARRASGSSSGLASSKTSALSARIDSRTRAASGPTFVATSAASEGKRLAPAASKLRAASPAFPRFTAASDNSRRARRGCREVASASAAWASFCSSEATRTPIASSQPRADSVANRARWVSAAEYEGT